MTVLSNIECDIVIIVSANSEWKALLKIIKPNLNLLNKSPYGEWFIINSSQFNSIEKSLIFLQGGWGKVNSAGSTQWTIDNFKPKLIINIGTAGGLFGSVKEGDIVYATNTIIYDIFERMGDELEAVEYYSTKLGSPPLSISAMVSPSTIISADQDINPNDIFTLKKKYNAIAADWESGAIAHICKINNIQVNIIKGISDVVDSEGSKTYGNIEEFNLQSEIIIKKILLLIKYII